MNDYQIIHTHMNFHTNVDVHVSKYVCTYIHTKLYMYIIIKIKKTRQQNSKNKLPDNKNNKGYDETEKKYIET